MKERKKLLQRHSTGPAKRQASKRSHHIEPRRYLQGFSVPGQSFIWEFAKEKPYHPGPKRGSDNPAKIGLRKAGAERDAYAVTLPDGQRDFNTYEDLFQKIETTADHIWPLIENREPIVYSDKGILAGYICHLVKRTQNRVHKARPLFVQEAEKHSRYAKRLATTLAHQGAFGPAKGVLDDADYWKTEDGIKVLLLKSADLEYEKMKKALMDRTWALLVAPSGFNFVTSDNPVIFSGFLIGPPILFPLCRSVLLEAGRGGGNDLAYQECPSEHARQVNNLIIGQSLSTVYSSTDDRNIWNVMHGHPETPETSGSKWGHS